MKAINFVFLILIFFSCSPIYYAPNAHNVPVFTEKNQGNFSCGFSFLSSFDPQDTQFGGGYNIQTAYSFSNHFAAQANVLLTEGDSDENHFFDGAIGYFLPFDEELVFETYAGAGIGYVRNRFNQFDPLNNRLEVASNYSKYYIQPSISFHSKAFFASLDTRIAYLDFGKISHNITDSLQIEYSIEALNSGHLLLEPGISVGVNINMFQLKWQLYTVITLDGKPLPRYESGNLISVGFLLNRERIIK